MKGSSLTAVWPHMLALAAFAAVLLTLSVMRFRKQLG
jgi:ABC-type transport system involved in multi-copper enzyme maturation permease subunit